MRGRRVLDVGGRHIVKQEGYVNEVGMNDVVGLDIYTSDWSCGAYVLPPNLSVSHSRFACTAHSAAAQQFSAAKRTQTIGRRHPVISNIFKAVRYCTGIDPMSTNSQQWTHV